MVENSDLIIQDIMRRTGEKGDETEVREETQQLGKIIESQLKIYQLFSIIISLSVYLVFNFISTISAHITNFIVTGELELSPSLIINFIINLMLLIGIILLIMYLPKISRDKLQNIFNFTIGCILALVIFLCSKYYLDNMVYFGETIFNFNYLMFVLPFIFILWNTVEKKKYPPIYSILTMILGFLIGLIIVNLTNIKEFGSFIASNQYFILSTVFFYLLIILYINEAKMAMKKLRAKKTPSKTQIYSFSTL